MSIHVAKWTFLLSLCASRITFFFFAFYFVQLPGGIVSFLSFLVHRCSRIRNFHRLRHRNKYTHQAVMVYCIQLFVSDVILTISWKSRFQTLSCGFMSFHNTGILCFLVGVRAPTRDSFLWLPSALSYLHLTAHSRFHRNFQFLCCVLNGLFILFIFWIDEMDASQCFRALSSFGFSI